MDLALFDYNFPEALIAQHPLEDRGASRLMVLDPSRQTWEHRGFTDFAQHFGPEDLLIFNDVRVMPSRLYGKTTQGRQIEVLLLDQQSDTEWSCLVRPASKLKGGDEVFFGEKLHGTLSGSDDQWSIHFSPVGALLQPKADPPLEDAAPNNGHTPLHDLIADVGLPPLPPYVKRDAPFETKAEDVERYQTIYANNSGAAAAPTAGFHFTDEMLRQLRESRCETAFITLHVGRDTFQPVRTENIKEHKMHGESYEISEETAEKVMHAKKEGRRITAIGTTTLRALESAWDSDARVGPGYTEKFIYPGYQFKVVDRLLTNFHQPKSTLLMLVSAFAGREFILSAYQEAIRKRYRLFSFGDAMLVLAKY
jgi:S-adenosylmethionine:tRNA ribosyltransferase-isomerase